MKIEGGCLCGKVRYSSDSEPAFVGVCHCKNCQKQAGTSFSVVVGLPKPALSLQGMLKTFNDRGDSGNAVFLPGMRIADPLRDRSPAGCCHYQGRDTRRYELAQSDNGGLLRQRPALGQPRRRAAALPKNARLNSQSRCNTPLHSIS
jgi:Glutathione-dependent formaldehyde-activating enzyme